MPKADVSDPFRALARDGTVKAVRQEYQVHGTAAGDFGVFSPSCRGPSSFPRKGGHDRFVDEGKGNWKRLSALERRGQYTLVL